MTGKGFESAVLIGMVDGFLAMAIGSVVHSFSFQSMFLFALAGAAIGVVISIELEPREFRFIRTSQSIAGLIAGAALAGAFDLPLLAVVVGAAIGFAAGLFTPKLIRNGIRRFKRPAGGDVVQ